MHNINSLNKNILILNATRHNFKGVTHQDNDPKHTSRLCTNFLENSGINWIKAPSNSPDLNPIEMFWNQLKNFVRRKLCQSLEHIESAVIEFCETITPQVCDN